MKSQNLCCVLALISVLTACSTVPSKPVLSAGQSLTEAGHIQSNKNNFVVRVSKVNTNSEHYQDIAKYGLPVRVTVANLSNKPISFGPNNVVLYKNNKAAKPLTELRLMEIKKGQQRVSAFGSMLTGALAVAIGTMGVQTGDTAIAQDVMQQSMSLIEMTAKDHEVTSKHAEEKMGALGTQVTNTLLENKVIQPKSTIDGLVYFENISTGDPIIITVQTGEVKHTFNYQNK